MQSETKIIPPAGWIYLILAIGELIALSGAVVIGLDHGVTWLSGGLAALAVMFSAGMVDLAVSRMELTPDALRIIELLRRQSIAKREITSVKMDGGAVFCNFRTVDG